jgi:thiol-disulfide isomerase/thioredoxin
MYKSYSDLGPQNDTPQDQYSVTEIVNDDQKKQLLNSHRLVLVEVFADWCGPCKTIAPSYALLAMKYGKPNICSIVKQQYDRVEQGIKEKIQGIPIFLFYVMGSLVDTIVGGDLEAVEKQLQIHLQNSASDTGLMKEDYGQNTNPPPQYRNTIRNRGGNNPPGMVPEEYSTKPSNYGNGPSPQGHGPQYGQFPQSYQPASQYPPHQQPNQQPQFYSTQQPNYPHPNQPQYPQQPQYPSSPNYPNHPQQYPNQYPSPKPPARINYN